MQASASAAIFWVTVSDGGIHARRQLRDNSLRPQHLVANLSLSMTGPLSLSLSLSLSLPLSLLSLWSLSLFSLCYVSLSLSLYLSIYLSSSSAVPTFVFFCLSAAGPGRLQKGVRCDPSKQDIGQACSHLTAKLPK